MFRNLIISEENRKHCIIRQDFRLVFFERNIRWYRRQNIWLRTWIWALIEKKSVNIGFASSKWIACSNFCFYLVNLYSVSILSRASDRQGSDICAYYKKILTMFFLNASMSTLCYILLVLPCLFQYYMNYFLNFLVITRNFRPINQ